MRRRSNIFPALFLAALTNAGAVSAFAGTTELALTIQPLNVCDQHDCALPDDRLSPLIAAATAKLWAQAGISVTFLPIVRFHKPHYVTLSQALSARACPVPETTFPHFCDLTRTSLGARSPDPARLSAYFVQDIRMGTKIEILGHTWFLRTTYGLGWINSNGTAVSREAIGATQDSGTTRIDALAHEIGHNLGLDHTNFGNDHSSPDNLMTDGSRRTIPRSLAQIFPEGPYGRLTQSQIDKVRTSPFFLGVPRIVISTDGHQFELSYVPGSSALDVASVTVDFRAAALRLRDWGHGPTNTACAMCEGDAADRIGRDRVTVSVSASTQPDVRDRLTLRFAPGDLTAGKRATFTARLEPLGPAHGSMPKLQDAAVAFRTSSGFVGLGTIAMRAFGGNDAPAPNAVDIITLPPP